MQNWYSIESACPHQAQSGGPRRVMGLSRALVIAALVLSASAAWTKKRKLPVRFPRRALSPAQSARAHAPAPQPSDAAPHDRPGTSSGRPSRRARKSHL